MEEILFLKPVFKEKIWGGRKLEQFGYDLPAGNIGECWAISGHSHGSTTVENGEFSGQTIMSLWDSNRELFGDSTQEKFPLLTKILDAEDSLSVQVHPDDVYAKKHANDLGKTECWYVIDADPGAYLIFGHHAQTREEFEKLVNTSQWDKLLNKIPVKKGDFFYVPSGTVHALTKGIMVLETQQSSDTTYRLYDYDRADKVTGKQRELHLEDSFNVTTIPAKYEQQEPSVLKISDSTLTTLVSEPMSKYFNVYHWDIQDEVHFTQDYPYTLVSILDGEGEITVGDETYQIKKGQHFILTDAAKSWDIIGNVECIASVAL